MFPCRVVAFVFIVICIANSGVKCNTQCANKLDDTEWFQYGYDATELDIYKCPEIGGKRKPIFVINDCSKGEQWTNKYTNQTLDLPDNIHVYDLRSDTNTPVVFNDIGAYTEHLAADVGIAHEWERGLFALSDDFKKAQEQLTQNNMVIVHQKTALYTIAFNKEAPGTKYDPNYTELAADLPKSFKSNHTKYIEFIKQFGTHFMVSAGFGANVRRLRSFNKQKYQKLGTLDLIQKTMTGFPSLDSDAKLICKDANMNLTYKYKNEQYEQHFFGISPEEFKKVGFEGWTPVIGEHPYVVSPELQPISKLLSDDLGKEMNDAIKAYMAKALLDSLVYKLKLKLSHGLSKTNMTDVYLEEYETIDKTNNYDLDEIRSLTTNIKREARRPMPIVWWTDDEPDSASLVQCLKYSFFILAFVQFFAFEYFRFI